MTVFIRQVFEQLAARGIVATWEHPGYIHVPLVDYHESWLAIGDVNGPWNVDCMDGKDGELECDDALQVPADGTPAQVADLIAKAFEKWTTHMKSKYDVVDDDERSNGPKH